MFYHFGDFGLISAQPLFRAGNIFVDFFFVLSGFVIAAAYGQLLASGFSRPAFMALRFGRIYPLHIVVVAGFAAGKLVSGRSLFEGTYGIEYLLRAVFLLDGYIEDDPNFYSLASWSISVEMGAYLLAALFLGRGKWGFAAALAIWSIAVASYVAQIGFPGFGRMLQQGLIGFGMGAATWWLWTRLSDRRGEGSSTLQELLAITVAALLIAYLGRDDWRLLACNASFMAILLAFARERGAVSGVLATAPMQALGRWSYSIYLTHPLILEIWRYGLAAALPVIGESDRFRGPGHPGLENFDFGLGGNTALTLLVAGSVVACSALTFRFIEQPGRRWSRRLVGQRGVTPAEAIAPTI